MATEELFFPHNMTTSLTKIPFVPFTLNLFYPPILPQKRNTSGVGSIASSQTRKRRIRILCTRLHWK